MPRTPDPKKALLSECRELLTSLHRKHKPREWGGKQLKDLAHGELYSLRTDLLGEIDKQTIIAQIRELTPGKRNGKALDQFTFDQLRTHLAKLKGEIADPLPLVVNPLFSPPPQPLPVARSKAITGPLTLTLTFASFEALVAFVEAYAKNQ